jgi:hypothetical protein
MTMRASEQRVHDHTLTADGLNANFADVFLDS